MQLWYELRFKCGWHTVSMNRRILWSNNLCIVYVLWSEFLIMYFSKVKQKFELTHSTSASFCNLDPIRKISKIHHNQLSSLDILSWKYAINHLHLEFYFSIFILICFIPMQTLHFMKETFWKGIDILYSIFTKRINEKHVWVQFNKKWF